MVKSRFLVFALILVLGLGLVLAENNETNETSSNETGEDLECILDTDCENGKLCVGGECEDNEEENEIEIEVEYENETEEGKAKGKYKIKIKKGLGQVIRGGVNAGEFTLENGETVKIRDLAQNRMALLFGELEVEIGDDLKVELEYEEENETEDGNGTKTKSKFKVKLKNGRNAEIKIMPKVASERALERLRLNVCSKENNCTIELKEVGKIENNESKLAYEIQIERHSRILGIFSKKMKVGAKIDAEDGEVINIKKPWWAFLAIEPTE